MVDVFISYSRVNHAEVARLAAAVAAEGYSVWWDPELPPHRSYGDVITEEIGAAKAAIVIWSQSAAASEWVRAEADVARGQKKLIQASIDDVMPPMPFNQIQFASIGDWRGEADHSGWRKIKASLAELCGPREAPADHRYAFPNTPPPGPPGRPVRAEPGKANRRQWIMPALLAVALIVAGLAFFVSRRAHVRQQRDAAAAPAAAGREGKARFTLAAMIDDAHGYTYVHAGPSDSEPVIGRVEEGEAITTYPQRGDWWQVRTADGHVGYLHGTSIRLLDRRRPAPASREHDGGGGGDGGKDGAAAPAAARPAGGRGEILPDSGSRLLTAGDLAGLSRADLALARNEIFARRGRRFVNPALRRHFEQFSWYRPEQGEVRLNATEDANLRLIREAELR